MKLLRKNIFVKGGMLLTVSSLLVNGIHYLFYIIVAKAVGPTGYGEVVALVSYLTIFGIPLSAIQPILIRKLGSSGAHRKATAAGLERMFVEQLRRYWLVPIILAFVAFVFPSLTNLSRTASFVLFIALYVGVAQSIYMSFLQGMQLFSQASLASVVPSLFRLGGAAAALLGAGGITAIYSGFAGSIVFGTLYAAFAFHRHVRSAFQSVPAEKASIVSRVLKPATLLTTASLLGISLLGNVDVMFAKKIFSAHDAGIYGAWSLFAKTILYVLGPVNTLALIFFSASETTHLHRKSMTIILMTLGAIGLVMWSIYSLFSDEIIMYVLGNSFESVIHVLPLAGIFGILYAGCTIMNSYFIAQKHTAQILGCIAVPVYIIGVMVWGRSIEGLINVNVYYSCVLMSAYLYAYFVGKSPLQFTLHTHDETS